MAILIFGMACKICGKPMHQGQNLICFSPFVENELDALWFFTDACFHQDCFWAHPLALEADQRHRMTVSQASAKNRICIKCNKPITTPDDWIPFGRLGDIFSELEKYNYAHVHRACLSEWGDLEVVRNSIRSSLDKGAIRGRGYNWLLNQLSQVEKSR